MKVIIQGNSQTYLIFKDIDLGSRFLAAGNVTRSIG